MLVLLVSFNIAQYVFHVRGKGPDRWNEHVFGGKVVEHTRDSLMVQDGRGTSRSFVITPHTSAVEGKDTQSLDVLTPGTFVMVRSTPYPELKEEAIEIRIITTGSKKK